MTLTAPRLLPFYIVLRLIDDEVLIVSSRGKTGSHLEHLSSFFIGKDQVTCPLLYESLTKGIKLPQWTRLVTICSWLGMGPSSLESCVGERSIPQQNWGSIRIEGGKSRMTVEQVTSSVHHRGWQQRWDVTKDKPFIPRFLQSLSHMHSNTFFTRTS